MSEAQQQSMFEVAMATDNTLTDKQKAILRASLKLFAEKGFERTKTNEIAERAGVAEGTVYRHFRDKDALRQAVIAPLVEKVVPDMAQELVVTEMNADYVDLHDFLTAVMTERLNFIVANKQEIKIMFEVLLFSADTRQQLLSILGPKVASSVLGALDRFKQQGLIADLPTDILMQTMISMLLGYFGRLVLDLPGSDLQRQTKYLIDLLSKVLSPSK